MSGDDFDLGVSGSGVPCAFGVIGQANPATAWRTADTISVPCSNASKTFAEAELTTIEESPHKSIRQMLASSFRLDDEAP